MNNQLNAISVIMFDMMNAPEFTEWLNQRIQSSGLSQAQIARRGNISPASISNALDINGSPVGWDVCYGIALAIGEPPILVFRKAGLLPSRLGDDSLREEASLLFADLDQLAASNQRALEILPQAELRTLLLGLVHTITLDRTDRTVLVEITFYYPPQVKKKKLCL